MEFVDRNDVIEQLAADRAYPSLCSPVLPWATQGGGFRPDAEVFDHLEDSAREDRVVVVDQEIAAPSREGRRLAVAGRPIQRSGEPSR